MSHINITEGFYSASKNVVVDALHPLTALGLYSHKNQQQLEAEYGPLERLTLDEAVDRTEKAHLSNPEPISEDEYERAFCCMPPENSGTAHGVRIFQFMEKFCGRVTSTFAQRPDGKCFTWHDIAGTPRPDLALKVLTL